MIQCTYMMIFNIKYYQKMTMPSILFFLRKHVKVQCVVILLQFSYKYWANSMKLYEKGFICHQFNIDLWNQTTHIFSEKKTSKLKHSDGLIIF